MAIGDLFNNVNIFGAGLPAGSEGLLTDEQQKQLANQSLVQGLLGTAASYLAQPKTGRYGSALPYLGKAYLGGMQSSQGAYNTALNRAFQAKALEQRGQKTMTIDRGDAIDIVNEKGETIRSVPKGLPPKAPTPTMDVSQLLTMDEVKADKFGFNLLKTDPKAGVDYFTNKFEKEQPALSDMYQKSEVMTKDGRTVFKPTLEGLRIGLSPIDAVTGKAVEGPVEYAPTKAPTSEQAKSSTYFGQMNSASKVYDNLVEKGFDPSAVTSQVGVEVAGGPFRFLAGAEAQKARQAQEQWSEAFLRVKTGATATKEEIEANINTFFPRIGETDSTVIEQKRNARRQAEMDVAKMTQPGAVQMEEEQPATQQQPTPEAKKYYIGNREIVPNSNNTGWVFADTGEAVQQ